MRTGELAQKIGISSRHASRLARAGVIPNMRKPPGKQRKFFKGPKLFMWIRRMNENLKFREAEMSRAYGKDYGSPALAKIRKTKSFRHDLKWVESQAKPVAQELIQILKQTPEMPESEIMRLLSRRTRERFAVLRDLIDKWTQTKAEWATEYFASERVGQQWRQNWRLKNCWKSRINAALIIGR